MEVVPRFLRDVVDSVESGTDIVSSIRNSVKNQYGVLNEDIKKLSEPVQAFQYVKFEKDRVMLDINIFDLHFDKVAWHEESGENYDTRIANKIFFSSK